MGGRGGPCSYKLQRGVGAEGVNENLKFPKKKTSEMEMPTET